MSPSKCETLSWHDQNEDNFIYDKIKPTHSEEKYKSSPKKMNAYIFPV